MCGIWAYILKNRSALTDELRAKLYSAFVRIKHRGPDRSDFIEFDLLLPFFLGFHRLAIMDLSTDGDQPFVCEYKGRTIYTLCNGEIYAYRRLRKKYNLQAHSGSDCEVIMYIYREYGIETLIDDIKDGEFAFTILDIELAKRKITLYSGHDPTGVRPLFIGQDDHCLCFASELQSIATIVDPSSIRLFPPGSYMKFEFNVDLNGNLSQTAEKLQTYYNFDTIPPFKEPQAIDLFEPSYLNNVCKKVNRLN